MSARSQVRKPSPAILVRFALAPATVAYSLFTSFAVTANAQDYCPSGTVECGDGCMPAGAVCCGVAGYCNAGESCGTNGCLSGGSGPEVAPGASCPSGSFDCADGSGCCPNGTVCGTGSNGCESNSCCDTSGPAPAGSGSCDVGMQECAGGCIPLDAVCCGSDGYCDAGEYCTDTGCATEGSSEPASEPTSVQCPGGYEPCADECMPLGSVCCGARGYCDAGEFCSDTGCVSEADGEPTGVCPSNSFECDDGSGCCPNGTLCGTGNGDCGADSCCSREDPSTVASSTPLLPTIGPSNPSTDQPSPTSPSVTGATTTMEGGFTCAGQALDGCDVKFCANFDTNQGYYASDDKRFDCESASNIEGCLQDFADYCAQLNGTTSPNTSAPSEPNSNTNSASQSTNSASSSQSDDSDAGCSVAPQRSAPSNLPWAVFTPLAWLLARRRAARR
ncbi:MAG TPA: hypothetical protein VHM70_15785 [Polyangiaceae bacterium]|nr:hypothetical protein [Polyangiaceae bacterium]